ncbi:MAG TPA: aromatic-ring-hydroxylating dioxygenase subunit beta [Candidatus Sulfotelmatobacter sp.]|nr:aromatic-ring-hydroxylating dioxygenase subunit beta [Candidatus Sulfotelmatobacter sp.]
MISAPTRAEIEDLLFLEAELLDDWRLQDWLALFTDDARYLVPPTDLGADAEPDATLFYIADDRFRLNQRVARLQKRTAHSEFPHSKTRHLVSNVRIKEIGEQEIKVAAAFVTYRTKDGVTDSFVGSYRYVLARSESGWKIREKRCLLDLDGLRPQGRISILL